MVKKAVETWPVDRPAGRPAGSPNKAGRVQDAQIAFRLNAVEKGEWLAAADRKSVKLSVWMRTICNAAAKRSNR